MLCQGGQQSLRLRTAAASTPFTRSLHKKATGRRPAGNYFQRKLIGGNRKPKRSMPYKKAIDASFCTQQRPVWLSDQSNVSEMDSKTGVEMRVDPDLTAVFPSSVQG